MLQEQPDSIVIPIKHEELDVILDDAILLRLLAVWRGLVILSLSNSDFADDTDNADNITEYHDSLVSPFTFSEVVHRLQLQITLFWTRLRCSILRREAMGSTCVL